jgi:hypothetical protein
MNYLPWHELQAWRSDGAKSDWEEHGRYAQIGLPNAAVGPEAAVFVTATLPTAELVHAVAQVIELVPTAAPAVRLAK